MASSDSSPCHISMAVWPGLILSHSDESPDAIKWSPYRVEAIHHRLAKHYKDGFIQHHQRVVDHQPASDGSTGRNQYFSSPHRGDRAWPSYSLQP